jgi:excisionase family DNA binding protein
VESIVRLPYEKSFILPIETAEYGFYRVLLLNFTSKTTFVRKHPPLDEHDMLVAEIAIKPACNQISCLLTVREVAELLRVSQPTVLRMIEDGDLRAIRVRTQWRIRRADLDEYLQRGGSSGGDRR